MTRLFYLPGKEVTAGLVYRPLTQFGRGCLREPRKKKIPTAFRSFQKFRFSFSHSRVPRRKPRRSLSVLSLISVTSATSPFVSVAFICLSLGVCVGLVRSLYLSYSSIESSRRKQLECYVIISLTRRCIPDTKRSNARKSHGLHEVSQFEVFNLVRMLVRALPE